MYYVCVVCAHVMNYVQKIMETESHFNDYVFVTYTIINNNKIVHF